MAQILKFPYTNERLKSQAWEDYLMAKTQYEIVRDNYLSGNWLMQQVYVRCEDEYASVTRKLMEIL